ncbi:(Fe-S)-binding protein [Vibrio penaeicida]|uniref:(Fe-S)-binding protein n=1 Tax=Vibrio penaeicida TaxID=104609 RepID=UPI000CEA2304|nr:(Fe-S)-binding protein [Vibrio penaeicida]
MSSMQTLLLWVITLLAFAITLWRFWQRLRTLKKARSIERFDRISERLKGVFGDVGTHKRLLKKRYSGVLHLMIFSSFIVLFTAIIQAFGSGLFPGFSLTPYGGETWIALLQEWFTVIILIGVGLAAWQRLVLKPERFEGSNQKDAVLIYCLVIGIVLTMILEFSASIVASQASSHDFRPISSMMAYGLRAFGMTPEAGSIAAGIFYWLHILVILGFLIYIPGSKHRHMFTAGPNIFFRPLEPKGQLRSPDTGESAEGGATVVQTFDDFSWKDLLDTLSCTECGRCQEVCPAHAAGTSLSPKKLIMDLREGLLEANTQPEASVPIVGGVIATETLWSCTTCRACMQACPVRIEHVPKIVSLRRTMVEAGDVEPMLQTSLTSFQSHGNSFGKPAKQRARWTKGLKPKLKDARKEPVDILWFVGDFASFDARAQKLSLLVARLLQQAGVDVGILYDGERNSGNDVRRAGDEGLFELLAQHNIDQLDACDFNRIMTTDPHSLNALKSEYPALGANYDVLHYSELLLELIRQGKLTVDKSTSHQVTYHDPCYLGRYNDGFDVPRTLIQALGHELHEMPRNRENSFCCGAGGGRIFMDDAHFKERPSESRIREALSLGKVDRFVVSCPKDVVMYSAAVQALGVEEQIVVQDLAELVWDAVGIDTSRES